MTIQRKKDILINILFVAVIAVLCYFVFKFLVIYLLPFVIGFLLSLILQKPVRFLARKTRMPRGIWATILVLVSYVALVTLLVFIGYQLYIQIYEFVKTIPSYVPELSKFFGGLSDTMSGFISDLPDDISKSVQDIKLDPGTMIQGLATTLTTALTNFATTVAGSLPGFIITSLVTVISSCFIAVDYDNITAFVKAQLSGKHWGLVLDIKKMMISNVGKMLRGYAILMFMTFSELLIGLLILGYDYALALAAIISIVDILPVLGTGTVLIPWMLFKLISGDVLGAIGIGVLYAVITIVRNVMEPRVIGKQVGLPPLVTLLSIYVGLRLFGMFGMFGLPVMLIILKSLQDSGKIRIWRSSKHIKENENKKSAEKLGSFKE